jgi:hypothetical protein
MTTRPVKVRYLKLRKSELKGDLEALLRRAELVTDKTARPDCIFISKQDSDVMSRNCDPWSWLNLGPSSVLEDVIKPGYALIIEDTPCS